MTRSFRTLPVHTALLLAFAATGCFRSDVLGEDGMSGASGMGAGMTAGSAGMAGDGGGMTGNNGGMGGSSAGMTGGVSGMAGDGAGMTGNSGGMVGNNGGMTGNNTDCSALPEFAQVAVRLDSTCAVTTAGELYCWGRNHVTEAISTAPELVTGIMGAVRSVTLGGGYGCALTEQGMVWCWGINDDGQLGNGSFDSEAQPTPIPDISDAEQIEAGFAHTCVVRTAGEVWCWGNNRAGQLGPDKGEHVASPTLVWSRVERAVQVTAGYEHTCIRDNNFRVHCIGANEYGQLGNGTNQSSSDFVTLGLTAVDVSAGLDHNCAVDDQHDVWCWGNNGSGQLGDGTTDGPIGSGMPSGRTSPVRVLDLHNVLRVEASHSSTCAISLMGTVSCWGSNQFGALGYGAGDEVGEFQLSPVAATLLGDGVAQIPSWDNTCALYDDHRLSCWGANSFGAVGDGTLLDSYEPVPIAGYDCN